MTHFEIYTAKVNVLNNSFLNVDSLKPLGFSFPVIYNFATLYRIPSLTILIKTIDTGYVFGVWIRFRFKYLL